MSEKFIVPKFRDDVKFDISERNGVKSIVLYDTKSYIEQALELPVQFIAFIKYADGKLDIGEFLSKVEKQGNIAISPEFAVELFKKLDEFYFLDTPRFHWIRYLAEIYRESPVKPPVCAGYSYPKEEEECSLFLSRLMDSSITTAENDGIPKAIIAPHIDFTTGEGTHKAYSSAYSAIANSDADLFVVFGTSHFFSTDYFMLTRKSYQTSFGIAETDSELLDKIDGLLPYNATYNDLAHKNEHSIEFQALILKYLFGKRNFKILPVLTGSLQDFIFNITLPSSDKRFMAFIEALNKAIEELGRNAIFIAGADLAHIGRKFGDNFDAVAIFDKLRLEDMRLIDKLVLCREEEFFSLISDVKDCRRICGLSPIYALMKAVKPRSGKLLHYDIWDEQETNSAVSFAGMAFDTEPLSVHSS